MIEIFLVVQPLQREYCDYTKYRGEKYTKSINDSRNVIKCKEYVGGNGSKGRTPLNVITEEIFSSTATASGIL